MASERARLFPHTVSRSRGHLGSGDPSPLRPPPVCFPSHGGLSREKAWREMDFPSWGTRLLWNLWAQGKMKMQVLCLTAEHEAEHGARHTPCWSHPRSPVAKRHIVRRRGLWHCQPWKAAWDSCSLRCASPATLPGEDPLSAWAFPARVACPPCIPLSLQKGCLFPTLSSSRKPSFPAQTSPTG